ncbi:phasin family protein [Gimibacter soli]|uniref:Phasin family protein n=1 Tax=Gimibacter soli TaxID=3024400 RepID=A0AAE9XPJ8_9PROT|nr:phasin family protein [Gimibacter soli]WCL52701.1 phasin family protein [Gimibacter soli]
MATKAEASVEKKIEEATEKMTADLKKGFEAFADFFKTPKLDVTSVIEFQKKNIEAAVEANKIAFEGAKAAAQAQIDMTKDAVAKFNDAATEVFSTKSPESSVTKGYEVAQKMFQSNLKGYREVTDLVIASNQKAVAVLQARYTAGVEELKASA